MPVFEVTLTRWEPKSGKARIKAESAEQAAQIARRDARSITGFASCFDQYEIDRTRNAKTSDVVVFELNNQAADDV